MITKAVRGAVQIPVDSAEEIQKGVVQVIESLFRENSLEPEQLISIQFTVTDDLKALNPASALRMIGYQDLPLFCSREPDCTGAMERMIRVLLTFNSRKRFKPVPVYLNGAERLRPDLFT